MHRVIFRVSKDLMVCERPAEAVEVVVVFRGVSHSAAPHHQAGRARTVFSFPAACATTLDVRGARNHVMNILCLVVLGPALERGAMGVRRCFGSRLQGTETCLWWRDGSAALPFASPF